jgi:hypothetical protein
MIGRMPRSPIAVIPLATLAGLKLLLHLATHHRYGYERDELYFIACAKRLAWGYVDHPPFVPVIARLSGAVFDDSLLGLRLFPVLALTAALLLTGLMAHRLGGGRFAQGLAALAFLIAPIYLRFGTFLNIPSFEVLYWSLLAFLCGPGLAWSWVWGCSTSTACCSSGSPWRRAFCSLRPASTSGPGGCGSAARSHC